MRKIKISIRILVLASVILISSCINPNTQPAEDDADINNSDSEEDQSIIQDNPCNNILYPLALDNQWTYQTQIEQENEQIRSHELGLTILEVHDSTAELAVLDQTTGFVTRSTAECESGSILNFPITEMNMVFGEVSGDLILQYKSGVFMPSQMDFETEDWSNSWETNFTASGVIHGKYDNEAITIDISSSPVKMSWQVIEKNVTIQVPAGDFNDVVLINREITIEVTSLKATISGEALDISTILIINSNLWFSPFTGLLKQELDSATIQLFGVNFPIESLGKIELKSMNINK